jgi:hypothetical protein
MPISGKLEVTIKINQLPTEVTIAQNGVKAFSLDCGDRRVTVSLRPKLFSKLEAAAAQYPEWVAALTGQMGPMTPEGFVLLEPNLQVFEKKPKAQADKSPPTTP